MVKLSISIFRLCLFISAIFVVFFLSSCEQPPDKGGKEDKETVQQPLPPAEKKRVLFINSYHPGYEWSDAISSAICRVFNISPAELTAKGEGVGDVRLKIIYLDSKRQPDQVQLRNKGLEIKKYIEEWLPDVVITSDDNAAKYVIAPYFKETSIPFVFCGINWDASEYGLPATNVTGMLEVQLIDEILKYLHLLTTGQKIGFLKGDDMSARKEATFYETRFGLSLDTRFVNNFADWQKEYLALQQDVDMLLLGNSASISEWDPVAAKKVVMEYTRIPSGNWDIWMAPYALMTFATKPEEQGEWAAQTAKKILSGTAPSSIPVVYNVAAHVVLNMQLANQLNVKFPIGLIEQAEFVGSR